MRDKLRERFGWEEDDCHSRGMGGQGEDIILSPRARRDFPFSIECKNTESISIFSAYEQARANAGEYIPLVVHTRNRRPTLAILSFDDLLKVMNG